MAYEFIGNTEQYGSANENHAFAVKVDPTGTPVFSILDETIADVSGDFTLDLGTWDRRIIIVVVDDDDAIKLNAKANDWVIGTDTVLGTSEIDFLGSATNKTMISASSTYNGQYLPDSAFDGVMDVGDYHDAWQSSNVNTPDVDGSCWLQWDFGASKIISKIAVARAADGAPARSMFKDIKVLSSTTGVFSGEEIDHGLYQFTDIPTGTWSDYINLASISIDRHLRIEIHSHYPLGTANTTIKEIKFKERL